jgi:putative flippase GtrA
LSVIRDSYTRFRGLIHEVGKFGLVGIASTILTLGIQNVLYGHVGPTTDVIVSNAVATCFAFVGNRYWAFRHRKTDNMKRETVLFVFFNVVGTLIQTAVVDTNHYLLGNHDRFSFNIATVIGIIIATLFRLYCYRKFVFKNAPVTVEQEVEIATNSLVEDEPADMPDDALTATGPHSWPSL